VIWSKINEGIDMKTMGRRRVLAFGIILIFVGTSLSSFVSAQETQGGSEGKDAPQECNSVYSLLVLTPSVFKNELQPLVKHKNAHGLSTKLVTLSEVYHQMYWYGRDDAEKIKYFIKTAVEIWGIHYVLLVGGRSSQFLPTWYCPVRYVNMIDDWDEGYLSDLYFADIYDRNGDFSSWDSDGDGVYGEWYIGENAQDVDMDLTPDVAVGRLPCRNDREVRIIVQKIINYETTASNQPWFSKMLVVAGDTYSEASNPNWTGFEGEYYGDRAIENMTGFTPTRLYTSDETFSDKTDVITEFRKGYGFVYFVGHGSPKQWGNNKPNGTGFVQGPNSNDVRKFRNRDKLPVCVVSGCHNSQFDVCLRRIFNNVTRWKQEYVPECWSERILREPTGGSICCIGCTGLGFTKEDKKSFTGGINELEGAFFHAYGQDHLTILGDTWSAAVTWYAQTYPVDWNTPGLEDSWIDAKVIQSWALFGDPSLQIGGYPQ
jgi:Peptidase family C25